MSNRRLAFVVIVVASFSNAFAVAQENRGSPEQRAACAPDAFRLCASYIPTLQMWRPVSGRESRT